MECRDVRELADSFLAEELLTETNHEILRHIDTCPMCREDLAARRALRVALQRAFRNARDLGPSDDFMARLRTTLEDASHKVPARRRIRFQAWWTLAATILLVAALGLAYRGRDWIATTGALARAAVGDHLNCALQFRLAEKPITLEEAAKRYDITYRVLETLPPNDVITGAGTTAHVLERHSCVYGGHRFAHIVLDYRGTRVSLLVTAADGSGPPTLPGEMLPHVTAPDRVDAMSVVSFRAARHMVFVVGDVPQADLAKLADAVAGPLYRGLVGV
ncbi:MAG TPA: zf-HC2 domain-containing protein [Candidatus Acidoferrum sp.]|nr:zf-HC2 domain-containing protein [Candidatus Acidoferrum sp.]